MHVVTYSRLRVSLFLTVLAAFVPVGLWMYENFVRKGAFAGGLFVAVGVCGVPVMLRFLVDNRIVGFDRHRIVYFSVLGEKSIRWSELDGIEIEEVSGSRHLKMSGSFGTLFAPRINERLLGGGRKLDDIIELMERASAGVEEPVRRAPQAPARQAVSEPVAAPPRGGGFGRKGL